MASTSFPGGHPPAATAATATAAAPWPPAPLPGTASSAPADDAPHLPVPVSRATSSGQASGTMPGLTRQGSAFNPSLMHPGYVPRGDPGDRRGSTVSFVANPHIIKMPSIDIGVPTHFSRMVPDPSGGGGSGSAAGLAGTSSGGGPLSANGARPHHGVHDPRGGSAVAGHARHGKPGTTPSTPLPPLGCSRSDVRDWQRRASASLCTGSSLSRTSHSDLRASLEPVTGPIALLSQMHAVMGAMMLFCAAALGWMPVAWWWFLIYLSAVVLAQLAGGLLSDRRAISVFPMAWSFAGFFVFQLMSRQAHEILGVVWFTTCMLIFLQIGERRLRRRLALGAFLFYACYVTTLGLLMAVGPLQTYRWPNAFAFAAKPTACQRPISGEIQCQCWQGYAPVLTADDTYVCDLKIDLKINWALEGVVLAGILVVVLSLGRLQVFVNKYALARVERGLLVQRLKQQNADLTLQLNKIQPRAEPLLDLDSPITKVIACIRQIQASNRLDSDASEELDFVVEVLSSNQLFLPNLLRVNKDAMDGEVNQWLTNMIMNQNTQAPSQGSRPGSVMHTHYSNAGSAPHLSLSVAREIQRGGTGNGAFPGPLGPLGLLQATSSSAIPHPAASAHQLVPITLAPSLPFSPPAAPLSAISEERIATFLGDMNAWSFDLVALQELTQGQPLYYLGMAIFEYHNFEQTLGIDPDVMRNFLRRVEGSYRKVPYHNSAHAADVMHALHYFVSQMGLAQVITTEECLAAFIAAAVHDVDHLGVNNAFLINSDHQLAIRYNDTSVLENHHCAKAFAIMFGDPRDNPLSGFVGERFTAIRAVIVGMVLATDMAGHFERMTKFKSKMAGGGMVVTDVKDRQLILNTAIKCGDISNAAKPREISLKWTHLIMEEFYNQGDQERARGLPVSTFMDRQAPQVPKCQSSFIDYIVMPLFEAWGMYIDPQGQFEAIQNLNANREYWRQQSTELGKVVVK